MGYSKLALLRGSKGWTQRELSETSGVSRYTIIKLENEGIPNVSELVIGKLAKTFEMSAEEFKKLVS